MRCLWELASAPISIWCVNNYLRTQPRSFCHLFFLFCFSDLHIPAKQRFLWYFVTPLCSPMVACWPSWAFGIPLPSISLGMQSLGCCWDVVTSRINLVPPGATATSAGICSLSRLAHPTDGAQKHRQNPCRGMKELRSHLLIVNRGRRAAD